MEDLAMERWVEPQGKFSSENGGQVLFQIIIEAQGVLTATAYRHSLVAVSVVYWSAIARFAIFNGTTTKSLVLIWCVNCGVDRRRLRRGLFRHCRNRRSVVWVSRRVAELRALQSLPVVIKLTPLLHVDLGRVLRLWVVLRCMLFWRCKGCGLMFQSLDDLERRNGELEFRNSTWRHRCGRGFKNRRL